MCVYGICSFVTKMFYLDLVPSLIILYTLILFYNLKDFFFFLRYPQYLRLLWVPSVKTNLSFRDCSGIDMCATWRQFLVIAFEFFYTNSEFFYRKIENAVTPSFCKKEKNILILYCRIKNDTNTFITLPTLSLNPWHVSKCYIILYCIFYVKQKGCIENNSKLPESI